MKSAVAAALAGLCLIAAPCAQAAARDLRELLVLPNRSRVLIDPASLKIIPLAREERRRALLSIDNSRSADKARFYASDVLVEANCPGGTIAVIWSRGYGPDGALLAGAPTAVPHRAALPKNAVERTALKAICSLP